MKDKLSSKIIREFPAFLHFPYKKTKSQESVPLNENVNLKFINTIQKQLKLKTRKESQVDAESLRENHNKFLKNDKLMLKLQIQ